MRNSAWLSAAALVSLAVLAAACGDTDSGAAGVPTRTPRPQVISPGPYTQATATSIGGEIEEFIRDWAENWNSQDWRAMWSSYDCHARSFETFSDLNQQSQVTKGAMLILDVRDITFAGDRAAAVVSLRTDGAGAHTELVALRLTEEGIKMIGYGRLEAEPCEAMLFPGSS